MRRHYPGQDCYSLGALCNTYSISLENHHRALCDAKAAAHLLRLINRKREETSSSWRDEPQADDEHQKQVERKRRRRCRMVKTSKR
jgi:DNA polymerase III alpha subunit (gram-positive type)